MILTIIYALLGAYCIFTGVKTLITGKLSAGEEAKLVNYSKKGARTYKLLNVVFSFIAGLCVLGISILKLLEMQKILEDIFVYRMVLLGIVVVLVVVFFIMQSRCKKMTDDE